jgi:hypothetical protein
VKYFPGQTWCCGGKPLTLISWSRTSGFFSFIRWKLPSKEIGFKILKRLRKSVSRTDCCSFGGHRLLFSEPF